MALNKLNTQNQWRSIPTFSASDDEGKLNTSKMVPQQ